MPVIVHLRGIGFNRGIHNYGEMYSRKLLYSIMTPTGLGMQESVAVIGPYTQGRDLSISNSMSFSYLKWCGK